MASDDEFLQATLPALDLVHNLARRFVRERADAEDLVQDTYLRAWQAWRTGNRPHRVEAWLATICLNLGRDRLRRVALRPELAAEPVEEAPADVDVEAAAIGRVERARIARALWTLSEEQRIAIALMDIAGFTAAEVAAITGSPRGTVLARVHLAGIPHEDTFDRILQTNVVGTYNVFEAARRQGCARVVFASSLHVTGFYDAAERISPEVPVRPDSFYGVGKACGENLGRLYADKYGLEVVCVRIGTLAEQPTTPRHLSTWLSPRDAVELFHRCLVAPNVEFTVVYGTSANQRGWWDPGPAERLGYQAIDDAERWASEINSAVADPTESGEGPQGGSYAR